MNRYDQECTFVGTVPAIAAADQSGCQYSFHPVDDPNKIVSKIFNRLPVHMEDRDDEENLDEISSAAGLTKRDFPHDSESMGRACKRTKQDADAEEGMESEARRAARNKLWRQSLKSSLFLESKARRHVANAA